MLGTIRGRVLLAFLALVLVTATALGAVLGVRARRDAERSLEQRLLTQAHALAAASTAVFRDGSPSAALDAFARAVLAPSVTAVVLRPEDVLYASSPAIAAYARGTPEAQEALLGRTTTATRPNPDTGASETHVASPVVLDRGVAGVVWVAAPRDEVAAAVRGVVLPVAIGGVALALAAIVLAFWLARPLRPAIAGLTGVVRRLGSGDLEARVEGGVIEETRPLANAIDEMAATIEARVRETSTERDTLGEVIQTMADAVLVTDDRGTVTLLNPAAGQMFGVGPAEGTGKTLIEVVRDHDIARVYQEARTSGRRQTGQVEFGPDLKWLRVVATPIEKEGRPSILVAVQDLTEAQRLEGMRREFVANVSHELRTPLAAIKACVEALQAGAIEDRPVAEDFLERVIVEVDQLTEMVQRLLELSRVETGRARFSVEPLDLAQVADEVVDRLQPQARQKELALTADFGAALPKVMADRSSVTEVLVNLLGNAIKFTPSGGAVHVSAQASDGMVEVTVRDTGVGIQAEHLPHIFERFYKADRSRHSDGVGLGLALAKHLVQAHGGRIWAESTPGRGSTFHFTLPQVGHPAARRTLRV